jgi:hypothetical protein
VAVAYGRHLIEGVEKVFEGGNAMIIFFYLEVFMLLKNPGKAITGQDDRKVRRSRRRRITWDRETSSH